MMGTRLELVTDIYNQSITNVLIVYTQLLQKYPEHHYFLKGTCDVVIYYIKLMGVSLGET